jgi:ATP-dependent exoDNAse (exonuclease V) beta subunit
MAFRVYKASAGSGKTFTLVKEYLLLVLQNPEKFRRILAVTFTNKAANEMKARIIKALSQLARQSAHGSQDVLMQMLVKELGMSESEIRLQAGKVLSLVVHNYSDFALGTIDAFVHKLVRTFARDLNLPLQFEVELDQDTVVEPAVSLLLKQVGNDAYITNMLIHFVLNKVDDERSWQIERDLSIFCQKLLQENGFDQIKKLENLNPEMFVDARNFLWETRKAFESMLQQQAKKVLDLLFNHALDENMLTGGGKGVHAFFSKIATADLLGAHSNAIARKVMDRKMWASGQCKKDPIAMQALQSIEPELNETLEYLLLQLDNHAQVYALRMELSKNIHTLAVMSQLKQNMADSMQEENLVHISEFNKRIATLLDQAAVPYIYERLGERFQHYLIDEFQDTSILQWHNFLPLIVDALANQNLTLIVGDAKQAIYRFRSGEVEQFIQLPKVYKHEPGSFLDEAETSLKTHFDGRNLGANFRSDASIVQFNNEFFDFISTKLDKAYQIAYHEQRQNIVKPDGSGYVELQFLSKPDPPVDMELSYLERIQQIVCDQMNDGFQPRDIAILTSRKSEGALIARYLTEKGIGVVSAEALLLSSSLRVRILINMMKIIQNETDALPLTMLVHDIDALFPEKDISWARQLEEILEVGPNKRFAVLRKQLIAFGISIDKNRLGSLGIYDMVESLIRLFGFQTEVDPYIQFFLENVHGFQVKQKGSLISFIDYWEERKNNFSVIVPENTNSVRVMTIHKSKGLEFPVVIYPFANDQANRSTQKEFWVDITPDEVPSLPVGLLSNTKNILPTRFGYLWEVEQAKTKLDELNKLYVALTRPSRRLYVLATYPEKNTGFNFPVFFRQFLEHRKMWTDNRLKYTFGSAGRALPEQAAESSANAMSVCFVSTDWSHNLHIAPDPVSQWVQSERGYAQYWGMLVHKLLAEIRYRSDADRVLQKYAGDGTIGESRLVELKAILENLFAHERLKECFETKARVLMEAELMMPDGKIYRPDRCVFLENSIVVMDYKTGQPDATHKKQICLYKSAIQSIENKEVQAFLVYLNDPIHLEAC